MLIMIFLNPFKERERERESGRDRGRERLIELHYSRIQISGRSLVLQSIRAETTTHTSMHSATATMTKDKSLVEKETDRARQPDIKHKPNLERNKNVNNSLKKKKKQGRKEGSGVG